MRDPLARRLTQAALKGAKRVPAETRATSGARAQFSEELLLLFLELNPHLRSGADMTSFRAGLEQSRLARAANPQAERGTRARAQQSARLDR
jgi:hypothetical protein